MKWTVSLATVTLPTLVQTVSIKTFATTDIATKEECVLITLIPTPVSAMLAILVLIVRTVKGRVAVEMVSVWMRSTLIPVSAMLAIYTGADCEVDIDECLLMETVCSGHGNCSHGTATFTCSCDPGYTGQRCETDIDDCVNVNCSGQGNCTDRVNDFNCDCFPGYTDAICQTEIDDCDGINCSGNGGCVDMVNMFLCDCEPGYTGTDCETNIDDCVNRNCSGNGVCVDGVNSFSCECMSGFTGEMCNTTSGIINCFMLYKLYPLQKS